MYRWSVCWMMPVTISPSLPAYSSYLLSRSTSRMRCRMTCFAVCAAMRPKSLGVSSHSRTTAPSSSSSCAMTWMSPVSTSISTSASSAAFGIRLYAVTSAFASASSMISMEMPFSRSMFSSASIISEFIAKPSVRCAARCSLRGALLVALLAAPTRLRCRAPLEDRACLGDVVELDPALGAVDVEDGTVLVDARDRAAEALDGAVAVAVTSRSGLHGDEVADDAAPVVGAPERPLEAGAAHLEGVRPPEDAVGARGRCRGPATAPRSRT